MGLKVGIFGAGQAGIMAARWLPAKQELICFIDNSEKKQGQTLSGVSVCSLKQALQKELDAIWIAVLNRDAARDIAEQLRENGYAGEIIEIQKFRAQQDIRLSALRLAAKEMKERGIAGEMAELGVFRGAFAMEMNRLFPEKKLYLFDTFEGFDSKDIEIENLKGNVRAKAGDFSDTSVELVREGLPHPEQAVFCPGYFPESVPEKLPPMAFVSLDPDLYEPVYQGLKIFYPLLNPGGMILIHDYNSMQFPGVHEAVVRFCEEQQVFIVPLMDLHGSAVLIKQGKNE